MRRSPLIALAVLLVASPAFACTGGSVQISGDFQTGDKGWGEADAQFQPKGAEAVITPQVGTQTARWNAGTALDQSRRLRDDRHAGDDGRCVAQLRRHAVLGRRQGQLLSRR